MRACENAATGPCVTVLFITENSKEQLGDVYNPELAKIDAEKPTDWGDLHTFLK